MAEEDLDLVRFARSFERFLDRFREIIPPRRSALREAVSAHLGTDPGALSSFTERFDPSEHANLQLALDSIAAADDDAQLIGLPSELHNYGDFSFAGILSGRFHGPSDPAPPEYINVPIDVDRTLPCLRLGLYLFRVDDSPIAALVGRADGHGPRPGLVLDVVSAERSTAAQLVARLRERMHELNIYRGKILSFSFSEWGGFGVTFHELPTVAREDIVLPAEDLDAIEAHTIRISRHADNLRAVGRHLKRGLLLYGPPGTGKTLSVMYLCGQMPGRTTLLLSGPGAGALGQATAIARALQPSMVVLEDVDLVALERTMPGRGTNPLLFQLLNDMDGLAEDADVVFVLTTNRVELLEPALAARPGRIDQAVEIKLPDVTCRRRLLELYTRELGVDPDDLVEVVTRTEGVSAAFIKELARRAALLAADRGSSSTAADDVGLALDDLLEHSTPILRSALGANPDVAGTSPMSSGPPAWHHAAEGGFVAVSEASYDYDEPDFVEE